MSTRPVRYEWFDRLLDMAEDDPANEGIDAYAIAVAAALVAHMNSDGLCWPSIRLLVAESRCSANVVQDRIARLERNGLLTVERHRRSANRYQATVSSGDTTVSRDDTDRATVSSERRSVSSERRSVSSERRSVSSERSSVSPRDTEQGNRRSGEPVNRAAFGGALPKGRAPFGGGGGDDTGHKLMGLVKEIVWKLDSHDEELGLPDDETRDTLWLAPGFEDAVEAAGLWVNDGQDVNPNLTREQVIAIRVLINEANSWLNDNTRYPPAWMWNQANAQHAWKRSLAARTRSA